MTCYSVQPRDWIFVKGYGFLSFAINMGRNIGKNIGKNVSRKYSKKLIGHAKQFATDTPKTASKKACQKIAEATVDLIDKKIHNKIIQTQLEMTMMKKYLKKDIYLQKKIIKLLIIWD